MQRTLGIVSFNKKSNIVEKISTQDDLSIVFEKKFELSVESAKLIFDKQIKEPQTVFGFILEGLNAIEDWLHIIDDTQSKSLFHGSLNPENAQTEIDWFQNESFSSTSSASSSSLSSSSSIPVKVANNRKNVIKKTTTSTKQSSVSGTTSPHQRKLALRDTTSSPDGPRNSLRKPTPIVRNSKIPNTRTPITTTTPLKTSRISNTSNSKVATPPTSRTSTPPIRTTTATPPTRTTTPKPTAKSITKQLPPRRSELNGRRGSLVTATATTTATTKKLTTTTKGGVSKNTPPTSIITGRTRKYSKVTEKKPVLNSTTATKPKKEKPVVVEKEPVKEVDNEIKSTDEPVVEEEAIIVVEEENEDEDKAIVVAEEEQQQQEQEEEEDEAIVVDSLEELQDIKEVEEPKLIEVEQKVISTNEEIHVLTQQPVSHPSTCSSADEHDAEVAAATSHQNTDSHHVKIAASIFQNNGSRRSSSFSPNSVSSLPRPETPEVDQLRLRFENIIQTSSPTVINELQTFPRRPSSKMSPEFISRIKEMKPKGPVGSKVKSMVELFMDENLNKWEF